jgi:hypothetical protein
MKKLMTISLLLIASLIYISCKKDFLDEKPNKALLIPTTLTDMGLLLDNLQIMNRAPAVQEIASDDFYTTATGYVSFSNIEKNAYVWAADIYEGAAGNDWNIPYQQIFYANIVLDGLKLNNENDLITANLLQGTAYFYRGLALYNLSQLFAVSYQKSTANTDLGLPIRLTANVNDKSVRSNLQQTYDQIINDLLLAKDLLPLQSTIKSKPNKTIVNALLARIYLSMGNYNEAELCATACLKQYNKLIDYNTLNATTGLPFPTTLPNGNDEVLFHTSLYAYGSLGGTQTIIDPNLYASYEANDLRKKLFFVDRNGLLTFKGTYSGPSVPASIFSGLATDEIYLTRAECLARKGDAKGALDDLNLLLINRFAKGTFSPIQATNADDALAKVLKERRKELISRGLRWTDLRRLNIDPKLAITLSRTINGTTYTLLPNSNRYVFPIPDNEIKASGIEQNAR